MFYNYAVANVTVSNSICKLLIANKIRKTSVIYNPVDYDLIQSKSTEKLNVSFDFIVGSGRMDDNTKQFDQLISAYCKSTLPDENIQQIKKVSTDVLNQIKKILNDQKVGEIIREGFKIAIVGPTNAGKSSLLNNLSNRDVAIVSEIAGTTRDVIETHLNIDGYPVIISDTAGIRNSKDEIEKKGIKLSLDRAENADLKLVVVDAKSIDLKGFLNDLLKDNAILVVNKSDLIEGELGSEVTKLDHVLISIKENLNLDKLISKIKDRLKTKFIINEDILITRERHRQHLVQCSDNLTNFLKKNDKKDFDKAAEDLRLATRHLGMIVGKVDVEHFGRAKPFGWAMASNCFPGVVDIPT